jgi:hypothetical protein
MLQSEAGDVNTAMAGRFTVLFAAVMMFLCTASGGDKESKEKGSGGGWE